MKRFLCCLGALCLALCSISQTYSFNLTATVVKKYANYPKGTVLKITGLEHQVTQDPATFLSEGLKDTYNMLLEDGTTIPLTNRIDRALNFEIKTVDDLWNATILQDVIPMLMKNGTQVELRNDAEQNALEYISAIKYHNMEFNDPYLLNYLYALLAKIAPSTLIDGRPGTINLIVEDNPDINAGTYPNGTIVINTGLLSAMRTEDELVAVLAHEVAHFVLDHSMQNINAQIEAKKRAEIAVAIATILTGIAEGAAAYYSNGYYMPGAATAAVAVSGTAIANQAVIDLGMEYNHKQELEADAYALQVLDFLGYDHNALASALTRMKDVMLLERSKAMYFASESHPALVERIKAAGVPNLKTDVNFERIMSFAITNTAYTKFDCRRFREALKDVSRNIDNNVATTDDYLIKANCLLALYDTDKFNQEVLSLIQRAKEIQPDNVNIYKAEILAELRLKNNKQAIAELREYRAFLDEMDKELPSIQNEGLWKRLYSFTISERNWVDKMLIKLNGMKN